MDVNNFFFHLAGLLLAYAYEDLSYNKLASQLHTDPRIDKEAGNAVDRNTATCMRTRPIGENSPDNTVWWKVDLGGVYSIYRINVLFKLWDGYETRQRGRFAGFSLYVSITGDIKGSTLCYKDGPLLPPLNFTTTCSEYGRYVIFYNERLDGVLYPKGYELYNVFTDLCEVVVKGCNGSVYGSNCDNPCPINCKYNICHIQSGTCFGCKPGWTGTVCNIKCMRGWYGVNCSHPCVGYCKDGTTCNHVTGQCNGDCNAGWTGIFCDKECADGTYGYDCVKNCSGHCMNGSQCNKQTGHCDMGCNPGYTDSDCSRECGSGYFGLECRKQCSGNCVNKEGCNHVTGFCPRGCIDGYIGRHCNISCHHGYYGKNCSLVCSPNCKICRHTDGLCSCKAGWMGQHCSIECIQSYGEDCQYPCSGHCTNRTCDRFNGNCLCDCKYDSLRNVKTNAETDVSSYTLWIVAFSISMVIHIVFISATLISRRNIFLKQISTKEKAGFSWRSRSNTELTLPTDTASHYQVTTDDASHYQELRVSKDENTYQTLD